MKKKQTSELAKKTDKQLKDDYLSLSDMIDNVECFGTKDVLERELIVRELYRRGYTLQEDTVVTFVKEDTDDDEEGEEKTT